ncbi:MAG: outer membrane factor lipoprotein domain-containing protein [Planctomycetota bacterium]|jgi:outer membrane protein TolC
MKTLIPAILILFAAPGLARDVGADSHASPSAPLHGRIVMTIHGQETTVVSEGFGDEDLRTVIADALRNNENLSRAAKRVRLAADLARAPGDDLSLLWWEYASARHDSKRPGKRAPVWSPMGVSLDLAWERTLWSEQSGSEERDRRIAERSLTAQTLKVWLAEKAALHQVRSAQAFLATCHDVLRIVRTGRIRGSEKGRALDAVFGKLSKAEFRLRQARTDLERITRQLEILTARSGRSLEERPMEACSPRTEIPLVKSPVAGAEGTLATHEESVRGALDRAMAERRAGEELYRKGRGSLASVLEARERETGLEILSWNLWRERQIRRVNLLLAAGDAVAKSVGEGKAK